MKRLFLTGCVLSLGFCCVFAQPLAFPGAEGFGANSRGGSGGKVIYVSNLNDEGPGSLREAVEQEGPRTVVFSVSGIIDLKTRLNIEHPYITIAGQTAPGDGICLRGETLRIAADHVIVRYLRVRLGDGKHGQGSLQGKDAISISSGRHIILDHCSAGWSLDEVLSASTRTPDLSNVTVQWCFITEGLNPDGHGFGSLIRGTGGAKYSFLHNLYAHNRGRNPRPGNYDSNPHDKDPLGLLLDFRNNVVYNWGGEHAAYNADKVSVTRLNFVNNYFVPGQDSKASGIVYSTGSPYNRAYFAGNYYRDELPDDPWKLVKFNESWSQKDISTYKQDQPFESGIVQTEDAPEAYKKVLETGGAVLPKRDAADQRIVKDVRQRTGRIIQSQEKVGGWPELKSAEAPLDSDLDGMPDEWEKKHGLNPKDPEDRNKLNAEGYTMLEQYLNSIGSFQPVASGKHRVIVLTDIENEPDDAMSLVRFLCYCNQWDVEGLVATTSVHQQKETAAWRIKEILQAYGRVRDNLEKQEPGFPTADYLLSVLREGRPDYGMRAVGKGMDSPGSELIIQAVDRPDSRPVWVLVWGGPNCLAQALWKVKETRSAKELEHFVSKLRVYTISDQDDSGPWIRKTFPELFYIASPGFHRYGGYHYATWSGISGDYFHARCAGGDFSLVDNDWVDKNVQNKGPLGEQYPDIKFLMEGDSPSFMFLIDNGLGDPEHPDWGSWGGRYEYYLPKFEKWFLEPETRPLWTNAMDEVLGSDGRWHTGNHATIWRWREHFQNDFSARMDWTIKTYEQANHPPVPKLGHEAYLRAKAGERVNLSAAGSSDPDGDSLRYNWFMYGEPGTFAMGTARTGNPLKINDSDKQEAWFIAPEKARMGTMHIILAVSDDGHPSLTRYKRVIVEIQ